MINLRRDRAAECPRTFSRQSGSSHTEQRPLGNNRDPLTCASFKIRIFVLTSANGQLRVQGKGLEGGHADTMKQDRGWPAWGLTVFGFYTANP
jgi:hypothetical protein